MNTILPASPASPQLMLPLLLLAVTIAFGAILLALRMRRRLAARRGRQIEHGRRRQAHAFAVRVKERLRPSLRPLGMKHIHLEPFRDVTRVRHRRRLKLHADLLHQILLKDRSET